MLVIREAQLQAFRAHAAADFRRRLAAHLLSLSSAPGRPHSREDADAQAERAIARAGEYGLTRERDVARFAGLVCAAPGLLGADPLPVPALRLLYAHGAPGERLDRLEAWVRAALPAPTE